MGVELAGGFGSTTAPYELGLWSGLLRRGLDGFKFRLPPPPAPAPALPPGTLKPRLTIEMVAVSVAAGAEDDVPLACRVSVQVLQAFKWCVTPHGRQQHTRARAHTHTRTHTRKYRSRPRERRSMLRLERQAPRHAPVL